MKISVFYHYLAEQLHTHVRVFDKEAHLSEDYCLRNDLNDFWPESETLYEILCRDVSGPRLSTVNDLMSYMRVPVENNICVIGPVSVCANVREQFVIPQLTVPDDTITRLYAAGSSMMIKMGVLLYNMFADNEIDVLACYNSNCTSPAEETPMKKAAGSLFGHEEYGENHNPIELENREMKSIESGNTELLRKCWAEDYNGRLGRLSTDSERHAKYLCIINITLSARAAIRGGLPSELVLSLCDAYCQQIDEMGPDRLMDLEPMIHNIQLTLAKLVSKQKGDDCELMEESPLVFRAKNYIFSHLHGKLTVEDVAKAMGTHPTYLNRMFRKSTGYTVHETIMRDKINLAVNMLTYSEYSNIEIANYLGFSSQSHLGAEFKKQTGMTLRQYRVSYHRSL